jgi:transposase-like protein
MIQHGGQVVIKMLPNVQQVTIGPIIQKTIVPGSLIYTDGYAIYDRLRACENIARYLLIAILHRRTMKVISQIGRRS